VGTGERVQRLMNKGVPIAKSVRRLRGSDDYGRGAPRS